MAFIQRLGQLRSPVSTYANLPLTGNVLGDVRLATDTGDAYTWMLEASSGLITDWKKVTTSSYSDLIGAPYSTALDIDNAVKVVTSLAINIALLAYNTLVGYGSAVAKMFDGIIHKFTDDNSGLELDESENYVQIDNTYYMPNKGDLDINTKMLIHGDGIEGSTSFVDLLRLHLYNHGATVDTVTKKFGTGSIKFDGASSCDLGSLVEGSATAMFQMPMTFDFWLYAASGVQPIVSNEEYIAEEEYQTSYAAGEVVSIKKDANNKIDATILSYNNGMMGQEIVSINVVSSTSIAPNTWTHVAIQRNDLGYVEIWINGVLDATSTLFQDVTTGFSQPSFPVVLTLGKLGASYLTGNLDEIRLSNIARYSTTFTPMTKAYNTATTPAPEPVIDDESDSNHAVTVHGNARMSGTNPLFGNASLYLDGVNSYLAMDDSNDWQLCASASVFDEYVKFLLHLNNDVVDEIGKTVTNNNVTFSDTIKKFGSHAASFNGSSSYLSAANSTDWDFGTGDFTIDCWVRLNVVSNTEQVFCGQSQNGDNFFNFFINTWVVNNKLIFASQRNASPVLRAHCPWTPSANTWYHIAVARQSGTIYMFIDGVKQTVTIDQGSAGAYIGGFTTDFKVGQGYYGAMNGYIDELRVSKGIARYTESFTPESDEYSETPLGDYTIDMWICPKELDVDTEIMSQANAWTLKLDGTSNKYVKFSVVGGNSLIAPITLSLDTWQHIAVVQYNQVIKLYIDGVLGASVAASGIANSASALAIGSNSVGGGSLFYGFIENVRISKGIARWTDEFTPPTTEYSADSYTKLLLPLNVQTVPNMVLQSVGYVSNYVPTSARVVIFEEDIDVMEQNVDLKIEISRDGGTTFSPCLIAKDQEYGDGTLNIFSGSVDLSTQPNGELMVWKLTTLNNKDCRVRGVSLYWR